MIQDFIVEELVEKYNVPERIVREIKAYVERRAPVGDFLFAVICNDLVEAVNRADDEVVRCLRGVVRIFYNQTPSLCWRTKEKYQDWLNFKGS